MGGNISWDAREKSEREEFEVSEEDDIWGDGDLNAGLWGGEEDVLFHDDDCSRGIRRHRHDILRVSSPPGALDAVVVSTGHRTTTVHRRCRWDLRQVYFQNRIIMTTTNPKAERTLQNASYHPHERRCQIIIKPNNDFARRRWWFHPFHGFIPPRYWNKYYDTMIIAACPRTYRGGGILRKVVGARELNINFWEVFPRAVLGTMLAGVVGFNFSGNVCSANKQWRWGATHWYFAENA